MLGTSIKDQCTHGRACKPSANKACGTCYCLQLHEILAGAFESVISLRQPFNDQYNGSFFMFVSLPLLESSSSLADENLW
jgi:hypothetical protein